jgi:hypothetical protein
MFTNGHFPEPSDMTLLLTPHAPLHCIECHSAWDEPAERWRLKLLVEDGGATETVPYCPACHAREFE